jgi:thiamine kinase-like enzyme
VALPKVFDPMVEVGKMRDILSGLAVEYPEFAIDTTIERLKALYAVIDIPASDFTPSHNDLLAENFIMPRKGDDRFAEPMYIIDWEYAGMAPRYYDIADMFQEILVPRDAEKKLVRCYCREGSSMKPCA